MNTGNIAPTERALAPPGEDEMRPPRAERAARARPPQPPGQPHQRQERRDRWERSRSEESGRAAEVEREDAAIVNGPAPGEPDADHHFDRRA